MKDDFMLSFHAFRIEWLSDSSSLRYVISPNRSLYNTCILNMNARTAAGNRSFVFTQFVLASVELKMVFE